MAKAVATLDIFHRILSTFPEKHLRMAFAYGSGVFQQQGHADMSKNMLDFIFVVDNPAEWHQMNIQANSNHYSFLKLFGHKYVAHVQDHYGAKIYFNTLVPCEGRMIKYGVIGTKHLVDDLIDWNTLYVSGRLHKPVKMMKFSDTRDLRMALGSNQRSALHTALLTLPELFTEEDLFLAITGLSYSGDFRMTVGEDKNKVENIVKPNIERFRAMYEPVWKNFEEHLHFSKDQGIFEQSLNYSSKFHHLNLLPKMVLHGLISIKNRDGRQRDAEDIIHNLSHDTNCGTMVQNSVAGIVKSSSLTQSVKGIFTAGVIKSYQYSAAKLKKMWKSKEKSESNAKMQSEETKEK